LFLLPRAIERFNLDCYRPGDRLLESLKKL
jgi:hypothetical protein